MGPEEGEEARRAGVGAPRLHQVHVQEDQVRAGRGRYQEEQRSDLLGD